MNEIVCPNCKKAFKVDEAGFADILKQVRDHEFEEELQKRLNLAEQDKENAVKLADAKHKNVLQEKLALKDKELEKLKADNALELAKKDTAIAELKTKSSNADIEKKLSVAEAVKKIEKERDDLAQ
jgi:hypothetical protein